MKEKARQLLHSRTVFSQGFLRKDGLIDIVGIITDTKSYDIPKSNGTILNSGEPLHEMKVTLTINMEMKVIDANAETYSAPYKICKEANFKTSGLIGETVGPGWKVKVNTIIGGSNGCTHVRELLISMATVAYQTIYGEKSRLTRDPEYNINLGSHYIAGLILQYDGAYPFAVAAYNAGPNRVKYWNKINKNPQKKQIDYINWIELIKFKETRNYVQRVLENYNVYRYILEKKPIPMKDFFLDQPLF